MVGPGGSFINNGRVAYVNGEFENNGDYCAYFNWADDGSSVSAYVNGCTYGYNEWDEEISITSEVTKEPTCTEPGVRTFTGTFIGYFNSGEQEFTDTKEVEIAIDPNAHSYTNNTLTAEPDANGLYAYACDNGCGTHTDDHIIKDFNGEGNHLELTKDGEGNYSTSEDITLPDGAPFSSPVDFTANSVTYTRNIVKDGGMYSFIVPFDIPAAQAAQLGTFYQYSKMENGEVFFDDIAVVGDGTVKANTAYLFDPAKDITSITVQNPVFANTGDMADAENPSASGLYGSYSVTAVPEGAYAYAGDGSFVMAGSGNTIKPFRAYLWLGNEGALSRVRAVFTNGEADAISSAGMDDANDAPIFNISGQRVAAPLKGGIYIVNGRKVFVNK